MVLEHEPDAMPSELGHLRVIKCARIVTLDEQASASRPVQQTYDVEQRALARAGRANESYELAFMKHEVNVVQDLDLDTRADIVRLADVVERRTSASLSTDRHHGIEIGSSKAGTAAAATPVSRRQYCLEEQGAVEDERKQLASVDLPQRSRARRRGPLRPIAEPNRADEPEKPALDQEDAQDLALDVPMARRIPMSFER